MPKMGSENLKRMRNGNIHRCSEVLCKFSFNVWEGTIFHNLRIKHETILRILELWMIKASQDAISYVTCISRKPICRVLKSAMKVLIPRYYNSLEKIGGEEIIVEID
ncbi:MAG: hypothetical protein KC414_14430, partial [Romboutsia sp.]|nr:hypothetical protein [Romboutsia sp.]